MREKSQGKKEKDGAEKGKTRNDVPGHPKRTIQTAQPEQATISGKQKANDCRNESTASDK
jgi:hypothetical protein